MSRQPKDDNNNPIPILPFKPGGGQKIAIGAGSIRSTGLNTQAVTLHATANCFFEVGDATVVASTTTSHYLPELQTYDVGTGIAFGESDIIFVSVRRADAIDGELFISERN